MAPELPVQTEQRHWEWADIVVCGTPDLGHDPVTEMVVAEP